MRRLFLEQIKEADPKRADGEEHIVFRVVRRVNLSTPDIDSVLTRAEMERWVTDANNSPAGSWELDVEIW